MEKILEMLRRHEGVENYVYDDHLGYATIGVGRCLVQGVGMGLSDEEVDILLLNDVKRVIAELEKEYPWYAGLNRARQDAMINLSFNLGATRLRLFVKALAAMEAGDYEEAANQFMDSKWAKQVGNRAVEVTEIIRTGEYQV